MEETYFDGWYLNDAASGDAILDLERSLSAALPGDYIAFLRKHNGGEGFIGGSYLILWKAEELAVFNREYQVHEYAPGLILFGSDGGGEGYAFDTRGSAMNIVRVPFIGMDLKYALPVCDGFSDLPSVLMP